MEDGKIYFRIVVIFKYVDVDLGKCFFSCLRDVWYREVERL